MPEASPVNCALRCRNLVKRYGEVVALAGMDLEVRRGECFGLLGPNGAGKTTTVEIFEGLRPPDSGDVEVLGDHWHRDGLKLRARLGIQLQETKFPEKLRVREVVTNLLSNALRYTPRRGEIQVRLTETGAGGERAAQISIQDSGPGIDPVDLAHVFDRFYKSSDSGGMGLGLSIAKYIVEAHGGKIWAESVGGRGTRISFILPAEGVPQALT